MIPEARKASRKGEPVMNTDTTFARFKKIDAHTHIGAFGSPFNIHFDTERLLQQMEAYNIEKTILVASGPHANEDTAAAFRAEPQKIIPLMWINCAEGKEAYDALEHYIRDEHFAGANPSLTATPPTLPVWIPWQRSARHTESPCSSTPATRPSPFPGRSAS